MGSLAFSKGSSNHGKGTVPANWCCPGDQRELDFVTPRDVTLPPPRITPAPAAPLPLFDRLSEAPPPPKRRLLSDEAAN